MKLKIQLNDTEEIVEVTRKGDQMFVTRSGETTAVRLLARDGAAFLLERMAADGELAGRIRAAGTALDRTRRQLWVNGQLFTYERIPERAEATAPSGDASLAAGIPAVVSQVLVEVGSRVNAGDKLILLESMKMVIPIEAPYAGVVTAINCRAGEAVQPGNPLVALEQA
ncbi:MAG: hypothetical protein Fur0021_00940 [Candidatus Promineifilaceae bacterium]